MTSNTSEMERFIKIRSIRRLYIKLIERSLKKDLKPAEHSIVGFIADRTLKFDKFWERITVHQICHGIKTSDGLWVHRGVNISERHVQRILGELLRAEVILRKPILTSDQPTFKYALNLENELFNTQHMMDVEALEDQYEIDHEDPGLSDDERAILRAEQLH